MTEPDPTRASGTVQVDCHAFELTDSEDRAPMGYDTSNGLVFSRPGHGVICTGVSGGPVNVSVESRRCPPPHIDSGAWDEIVDHSVETLTGALRVTSVMDDPPDLPHLTPQGPGTYRIRVHARGRDTAPDGVTSEPVEDYLLIVWPADPRPDTVHKQTDAYGAGLRAQRSRPAPAIPVDETDDNRRRLIRERLLRRRTI
ncbi:hypothetical protein [Streptomyces sp. N50]|uniref:hypothetical protein n=1 Tax=Streptomyces sp. N50 TaxID=3081765 RepID=UPI0029621FE9|nr:hypothetical protein [Streptomyces sp. N50]WOX17068.1 hypothetical protein R2B38_50800 [Streptomyces sp. N50]